VWVPPAEIEETPDNKLEDDTESTANTCFGVDEFVVELIPNWPMALEPQQAAPPPVNTAQVWFWPTAIVEIPVSRPTPPTPFTRTGVLRFVVELSPNWPEELEPQHWAVSFDRTAQECLA
jgi:hypothetical protein